MGSFFTNVQVRVDAREPEQSRRRIVAALRQWMTASGYIEVHDEDNRERTFLVGPVTKHPWITIYDSATEGQSDSVLSELTTVLSAAMRGVAIAVLMHDSDVLELTLFEQGARQDEYRLELGAIQNAPVSLTRWARLLVPGVTDMDLRAMWATQVTFAEEWVQQLAVLVDWSQDHVLSGHNSVTLLYPFVLGCFRRRFAPAL